MSKYHVPVMLQECLEGLNIKADGVYVDVTFGGGGHSKAILDRLGAKGKLVAFDQDEHAAQQLPADKRFVFIGQNFEHIKNHLAYQGLLPVDGLLADLGVSSHQFDTGERGFSFRFDDALLDMRMNYTNGLSAADILNTYTKEQLAEVFRLYGELPNAASLASQVVAFRSKEPIATVLHLKQAIERSTPRLHEYKFYAQVFQALRIEVNRELEVLKKLLQQSGEILKEKGRLVVMSYHSLEDRLVKNYINSGNFSGSQEKDFYGNVIRPFRQVSRKAITPSTEELEKNTRSRSAKLRIAEKI